MFRDKDNKRGVHRESQPFDATPATDHQQLKELAADCI